MQAIQEINEAFLIYHVSAQQTASEADLEPHQKAGTDAGCNLNPFQYVKQRKVFAGMASAPAISGIAERVPNTRSRCVTKAVQKQRNLPVFRDMKSNGETDDCRYFDPRCCQVVTAQLWGTKIHSKKQLLLCWEKATTLNIRSLLTTERGNKTNMFYMAAADFFMVHSSWSSCQ